jgi:cell division protein FtsW
MRTGNLTEAITRHVVFLFVGFVFIYVLHNISINFYKRVVPLALIGITICLILVLLTPGEGTKRWLFSRSFQPSDIAKVVMVVYLAKVLSDGFGGSIKQFFWRVIFPIIIVCGLIINGHTSNVAIIGVTSMLMVFMGAGNRKYHVASTLFVFIVLTAYLLFYKDLGRGETSSNRLNVWITNAFRSSDKQQETDDKDKAKKTGGNYSQAETARYAIVAGGFLRIAPGKSVYRKTLSEAHNDYIFAMIVEEYSLFGGMLVITVYLMLFHRILLVIRKCSKPFPSLLLSGLLVLLMLQTFIHIGVSVGGLPVIGQNLPMISTGGTSIIITCMAFGMILAVSRVTEEKDRINAKEQNRGTVV